MLLQSWKHRIRVTCALIVSILRQEKATEGNFLYVCKMRGSKVRHAVTSTSLLLYLTLENSGFRIHNGKCRYLGSINRLFTWFQLQRCNFKSKFLMKHSFSVVSCTGFNTGVSSLCFYLFTHVSKAFFKSSMIAVNSK